MLLTDDVYGTFVPGFRSLLGELPQNTIGVYSYSKYFGCTGWRLGVIAVHENNIYDKKIAALPDAELKALDKRYGPISLTPRSIKFIDRIVADSRDVALNHTAGLSLPQQVMMSLFSLVELMDTEKVYQKACRDIVQRRIRALLEGLGLKSSESALRRVLRPHRFRVLGKEEPGPRGGRAFEGVRASSRPGLPARRVPRNRLAQRRWLRRSGLVAAGVSGKPG